MGRDDSLILEDYGLPSAMAPKYWERLEADMRATGDFRPERLSHHKLRSNHYASRAIVRPHTVNLVPRERIWAYAARLKARLPDYQELALFYVRKDREGNGVLREIVDELIKTAPCSLGFFGISKRLAAMRVFERHGLRAVTRRTIPNIERFAEEFGFRDRLPDTALGKGDPSPRDGERWLFIRP